MNITVEQTRVALLAFVKQAVASKTTDVRETNFQGQTITYPCVRYEAVLRPDECKGFDVLLSVYGWSEDESSLGVTEIIDAAITNLHGHSYTDAEVKVQVVFLEDTPPPVRIDRLWRGIARFRCIASAV